MDETAVEGAGIPPTRRMVTATDGPAIGHGEVFLVGRDMVSLTWRDADGAGAPAALYRHRHNFEIVLSLKEASIQIFLPCEAGEAGSATFLAVCDEGAHAEVSLNIGMGRTMGFSTWDCPEYEHLDLPDALKEGSGEIEWDFHDPENGLCNFRTRLHRKRFSGISTMELRGDVHGLQVREWMHSGQESAR